MTRFEKRAGPGDVNCDDAVNVDDLIAVILGWGPVASGDPCDVDGSQEVDVSDMVYVMVSWTH